MYSSLKEKQVFFEQLEACRKCDDEADALGAEELALRQQCKSFCAAVSPVSAASAASPAVVLRLTSAASKLPSSRPRRTVSDPITKLAADELEIIAVTPRDNRPKTASVSRGTFTGDSIIPETAQRRNTDLAQRGTLQPTRVLRSQSNLEPSPSVSMAKRKRTKPLQMAPESEQIFKGLCFFYIPNDDINPARRIRITKAQEHGVRWTRTVVDATHVIVDTGLSYDDIKSILDGSPTSPSIVLVNDRYPIECLTRGVMFDPNQTVEKYQYKVPGDPKLTEERIVPPPSNQGLTTSLKLKPRRSTRLAANSTPESTQRNCDLVPSSHPEVKQPPKLGAESSNAGQISTFVDELATCIDAVLDDPEKHEYLDESDTDAQGPETDSPPKKKGKSRLGSRRNDANTNFGQDKFMCMRGGTKDKRISGPNADTIKFLEDMAEEHRLSNELWRVQSYRKAVATLRRQPKKIKTAKEAAALPNIGSSLANHIEEIAVTGRFEKLDQVRSEPSREALKIFCNVYGVGIPTAKRWVELGYRSLDDLRTKAKLSTNQQIGVDHYDDLLTRITDAPCCGV
ncbi:hypothetical protein NUW58_g323 [Xylaria curta]|uniref:Uncharacterized protein n=1 Tax=Xylaria curta TaxID=42375 RepID=A0ACC1PQU9_9PEZI|nr:hypothetical protein NUW58_g323 [Xylaria curta]